MDHKTWLWRKKSSERTIVMRNKSGLLEKEQEKEKVAQLERSLRDLNEQLSFARAECTEKDAILAKQAKVAEEAILGWEKAEAEAVAFKTQLDDTLCQKAAIEERISQLDESLNVAKEERELLIIDAAKRIFCEQDKVQKLEEDVAEKNNMITNLDVEISNLSEMLAMKEKVIKELAESKALTEENLRGLMVKLESTERSNSSLRYEVCMLQKQLELRSEERKFNLKSADASHKQHLESVKKITKLEAECQRLRSMLQKRLPGPAAIAKMRSEIEMPANSTTHTRRRRSNSTTSFNSCDLLQHSYDSSHGSSTPFLARLHAIEDENKTIKESLARKDGELQFSRTMLARTTSKLSQVEAQLEELSRGQAPLDLVKSSSVVVENPLSSISEDGRNEDNISWSGSWASALISELEHFKKGKLTTPSCRSTGVSDLSIMDDFVEIEKLAVVCADKPIRSLDVPLGDYTSSMDAKGHVSRREIPERTGKELVPVNSPSETTNRLFQHKIEKSVLKLIELVEGVIQRSSKDNDSQLMLSGGEAGTSHDQSNTLTGYVARAFLWKTSELTAVLQHFILVCNELLYGNADLERFVLEVNLTLDWIISHCFSLRDVSDMREAIIKHLELNSSSGLEVVAIAQHTGINTTDDIGEPTTPNELQISLISASNCMDVGSTVGADTRNVSDEALVSKLQESEGKASNLRAELDALKQSGKMIAHVVDSKSTDKEHGAHDSISKPELNEGYQTSSSLVMEQSNNSNKQETTSLESELQLEFYPAKEYQKSVAGHEEKHLKIQWEISTASEKLIECQETILNLGKQLKALASPKDAALFDKVVHTPSQPESKPRSQSLNQMLAMHDERCDVPNSPKTKEIICAEPRSLHERSYSADQGGDDSVKRITHSIPVKSPGKPYATGTCKNEADVKVVALDLVPSRQKGNTNLLKRLLMRRKKEAMTKPRLTISA